VQTLLIGAHHASQTISRLPQTLRMFQTQIYSNIIKSGFGYKPRLSKVSASLELPSGPQEYGKAYARYVIRKPATWCAWNLIGSHEVRTTRILWIAKLPSSRTCIHTSYTKDPYDAKRNSYIEES